MEYSVIIPARYASTRLPGKPLLDIAGKTMLQRVWERCGESGAQQVIVATDDDRIAAAATGFGAEVCMTSPDHASGTDRLQEVAAKLRLGDDAIVVNVQGDEPLIPPALIEQVAANLARNPQAGIATLSEPLERIEEVMNPNIVKVVADRDGLALYFSRAPIPWARDSFGGGAPELPASGNYQRHIGIYAYRAGLLHQFVEWGPAAVENTECLEQLRAMWNGARIHVAPAVESMPGGVDTAEDLERIRGLFAGEEGGE